MKLRALLATACLASISRAEVVELGVDNLAATIKSKPWTIVLFYDRNNEKEHEELDQLMTSLDSIFAANASTLGFAKLDIRRHSSYREAYKQADAPDPFIHDYFDGFPESAENKLVISHRTFMNLNGDLYWPTTTVLMADDFNVYSSLDLDFNASIQARIDILARWIEKSTTWPSEDIEELILSPINKEAKVSLEKKGKGNSFTFSKYFETLPSFHNDEKERDDRFVLEAGANESMNADLDGFYKHEPLYDREDEEDWLDVLALVIDRYLNWVEGYETKWDARRKAREDEQTNFGPLLYEMDQQLQDLFDRTFGRKGKMPQDRETLDATMSTREIKEKHETKSGVPNLRPHLDETVFGYGRPPNSIGSNLTVNEEVIEKLEEHEKKRAVPNLRPYLDEMVFGYGRSPESLDIYLREEVMQKLGPDTGTRQEARKTANPKDFAMFERMREYMKIVEDTNEDEALYLYTLEDLVTQWHNILVDFHDNLNQHYIEYLAKHPLAENGFKRETIEVIDMEDPENFALLSNYDAFHKRYTEPSVPVILGNVNMTDHRFTLAYLVEQCGASDVTSDVKVSNPVGEKSADDWGGLDDYKLDTNLLNNERKAEGYNRDLTLEQFIKLSRKLDNLYLHDFSLPDTCAKILHEETLYDEYQKFRIPSVLASYDLFHRVPFYDYASSWPSLFIGKKGSNSKIHVDSGATGFFMYLVSGRKRWIITQPSERPFLYERITKRSMVADVLGIDKSEAANEFLSKRFPLLHRVESMYEVIQEPGQLMYIPPDSPHAVENLEDTIGIALNLSPRDAFARHLHDQIHLDRQFGYSELAMKYMLFQENAENPMPTKDPLYMTFAEYKGQV